jgi:hypothetical protein
LLSSETILSTELRVSKESHSGPALPQLLSKSKTGRLHKTVCRSQKTPPESQRCGHFLSYLSIEKFELLSSAISIFSEALLIGANLTKPSTAALRICCLSHSHTAEGSYRGQRPNRNRFPSCAPRLQARRRGPSPRLEKCIRPKRESRVVPPRHKSVSPSSLNHREIYELQNARCRTFDVDRSDVRGVSRPADQKEEHETDFEEGRRVSGETVRICVFRDDSARRLRRRILHHGRL